MTDYCIHTVPFQILPPPVTLLQEKCIGGRGKVLLVLSVLANDRFLSSCCWRWLSETSDVLGVSLGSLYVWVSTECFVSAVCTLIPIATRGTAYHACFLINTFLMIKGFKPSVREAWGLNSFLFISVCGSYWKNLFKKPSSLRVIWRGVLFSNNWEVQRTSRKAPLRHSCPLLYKWFRSESLQPVV